MENCLSNELLSRHTTFKIGGPAKNFLLPSTVDELTKAIEDCRSKNEAFYILGGGSNLVFSDDGFPGTILCTKNLNSISAEGNLVTCQAGVTVSTFTSFAKNQGLSGFETFAGLPGTIGGAVFMNARCFEVEIADILVSASYLDLKDLTVKNYAFDAAHWAYKKSPFNDGTKLVLSATFKASENSVSSQAIEEKNRFYINERKSKGHFEFPSAGSVFKNNHDFGKPSGKIIDEAGLKGFAIGGAKVADFHGNFIINTGNATAADVKALVEYVKKVVFEKYGFALEEEIIFL